MAAKTWIIEKAYKGQKVIKKLVGCDPSHVRAVMALEVEDLNPEVTLRYYLEEEDNG